MAQILLGSCSGCRSEDLIGRVEVLKEKGSIKTCDCACWRETEIFHMSARALNRAAHRCGTDVSISKERLDGRSLDAIAAINEIEDPRMSVFRPFLKPLMSASSRITCAEGR